MRQKTGNDEEYELERNEVQFKHLSGWVKTSIIIGWALGIIWAGSTLFYMLFPYTP